VSDLYIPRISPQIWLQQNRRPILEIYKSLTDIWVYRNWETEHYNSVLEIRRLHCFISGNTQMGTRYLYWILTGPSFLQCMQLTGQWAWGQMNWNSVWWEKILYWTDSKKEGQKSLVPAWRAQWTNQGRTPSICTHWVPVCLSFNSQQGPTLLVSLLLSAITYWSERRAPVILTSSIIWTIGTIANHRPTPVQAELFAQ
jgi:hypothetical protein